VRRPLKTAQNRTLAYHDCRAAFASAKLGSGVIWNRIPFETLVIPAKAGIQSVVGVFPMACEMDSRLGGNACPRQRAFRPNDTTTRNFESFGRGVLFPNTTKQHPVVVLFEIKWSGRLANLRYGRYRQGELLSSWLQWGRLAHGERSRAISCKSRKSR
jgi:hypothetical protein